MWMSKFQLIVINADHFFVFSTVNIFNWLSQPIIFITNEFYESPFECLLAAVWADSGGVNSCVFC